MTIQELIDQLNSTPEHFKKSQIKIQIAGKDGDCVFPVSDCCEKNCVTLDINVEDEDSHDEDDCITIGLPWNWYLDND